MAGPISVTIANSLEHQSEDLRIFPHLISARDAVFYIRNDQSTIHFSVEAETFYRAVCAAWELVKPLPTDAT